MQRAQRMPAFVLTAEQRETLERWLRRPKTGQGLAQRAQIVLECAAGGSDIRIARKLRCNRLTVGRWRRRFARDDLDGLLDEPRPGAPRTISDADVERVLAKTLESKPRDATQWSTRSMAKTMGLSQSTISRIWRAFALKPHRSETFKLSRDPLYVAGRRIFFRSEF
jgi:transposase